VAAERNVELTMLGGRARNDAAELCQSCERIVLSLPTSDIVREVVQPLLGTLSGKTIIDTTTGDPEATDQTGRTLTEHGADFLVATIAGSSTQVSRGQVILITGGSEQVVMRCDDLFSVFSKQRFHVGNWLAAARMKLVVNLVLGLNRAVLAEGLSFARACGIDPRLALDILKAGPAFSRAMETKGERMVTGDFAPEARLAQHAKDVGLIVEQGEQLGASVPLSHMHRELLGDLVKLGFGDEDNSAIIRAFEREAR
jgi:3-hydroxyisobutyrate dehydrogenase-like beta-hydroxyacid dehydrogenase